MKKLLTSLVVMAALSGAAPAYASYDYSCKIKGKTFLVEVNDSQTILKWKGKRYSIIVQPNCAKASWHATGNGTSFDFCVATKGVAGFENNNDILCCQLGRECEAW